MRQVLLAAFGVALLLSGGFSVADESRLAVPDPKSQASAQASIKSLLKADYAKQSAADRSALAARLLKLADESKTEPVTRYMLLHEAQDVAAQGGDVLTAFEAVDATVLLFDVDSLQLKILALTRVAPNAWTTQANNDLATTAIEVADEASQSNHFEDASRALGLATSAAEKSHNKELGAAARQHALVIDRARQSYVKFEQALKTLQQKPDDVDASTVVGTYLCLSQGDWDKRLPYLVHAKDKSLEALAERDLALPTKPQEMQALADDWWQWSQKGEQASAASVRARAAFWYAKALADLKGLQKALAESRIAEVNDHPVTPPRVIDLMALMDLKRDVVAGTWELKGRSLLSTDKTHFARVRIRYVPPEEYDFRVTFIREPGNDGILQLMTAGDNSFGWMMGGWNDTICGFEYLAGKNVLDSPVTLHGPDVGAMLKIGIKHTSVVKVRKDSIAAYIDGALKAQYHTDRTDLSPSPDWDVGPKMLGVGSSYGQAEFQAVELIEVTGHGKRLGAHVETEK